MSDSLGKKEILKKENFYYHFDRSIYINRKLKKIFSFEFIEDNTTATLNEKIREKNESGDWEFYFSGAVSGSVKNEIMRILNR